MLKDAIESITKGCSTANETEHRWCDLHERLENYFKLQLTSLRTRQMNDQHNLEHRPLRAYVYISVYMCI